MVVQTFFGGGNSGSSLLSESELELETISLGGLDLVTEEDVLDLKKERISIMA